jgi:hypothetical protein
MGRMSPQTSAKAFLDVLTHLSELLDEALEQTFPASDPMAVKWR